ncbi:unnamed protein product [Rhizophagus irregularis]|nr:unnamed protein product [Rhizophagus irregularis]
MVKKSAEQGDVNTQLTIANLLREGKGVTKDETEAPKVQYNIALKWIKIAAELENPDAQFMLGQMYAKGKGVKMV